MKTQFTKQFGLGAKLAAKLGLETIKCEGHDLVCPCVNCSSSDALHIHQVNGVGYCFSCGASLSPYQLAMGVLGCPEKARKLMSELGVSQPLQVGSGKSGKLTGDPLSIIAQQKNVPVESLKAYGAKLSSSTAVTIPAYGPNGTQCTTMTLSIGGGKGLYAKGKPAGLFFPHHKDGVQLPNSGETWYVVEGVKDAAAMHGQGLLTAGLNTCRMAAKFARLFVGVDVVLAPDRDRAGEEGAEFSARVLRGVARSVRIAVLPAEFKESQGDDVRDILHRPDGPSLLKQAIADAQLVLGGGSRELEGSPDNDAAKVITLPDGSSLKLAVSPTRGKPQRLIVAKSGEVSFRDRVDTDSSRSRTWFTKKLAEKLLIEFDVLKSLIDTEIIALAEQVDQLETHNSEPEDVQPSQATLAVGIAMELDL